MQIPWAGFQHSTMHTTPTFQAYLLFTDSSKWNLCSIQTGLFTLSQTDLGVFYLLTWLASFPCEQRMNSLSLLSHLSKFYHFLWPFKFFLPHLFFCKPPRFFFLHKGILWISWALMSISYLAAKQILPNCILPLLDYVAISFQYLSLSFHIIPRLWGRTSY